MRITLALADERDREAIYAIRHEVYARELGQHPENTRRRLTDPLDLVNTYVVATIGTELAGFVSITPPESAAFSIDKYFARDELPLRFDDGLYEVRLLTVVHRHRRSRIAALLMYGAMRYVESRGGRSLVCIGRIEVAGLYLRLGFRPLGRHIQSGKVTYELLAGDLSAGERFRALARRLETHADWRLPGISYRDDGCYHGGAFFDAIGDDFTTLNRKDAVINADVLDAWFDPAPQVVDALRSHLAWSLKTSPPTGCDGMRRTIATARGVHDDHILPGAGSSDLIFLALGQWLRPRSRVLILDPMYGEYAHVLEKVIGCRVDRFALSRATHYAVDPEALAAQLQNGYDCAIFVNPNSPTGRHVGRRTFETLLRSAPAATRFWIDETYVDYAGASESLERFAAGSPNVVICKSMSKVYALSGARAAYLCGPAPIIRELRAMAPPWAVGLPAQIAACEALRSLPYYQARWAETRMLRERLRTNLRALGWDVVPGCANFLLCHLPGDQPEAQALISACRAQNLFLRDVTNMGTCFDRRTLRIAIKDEDTNRAMVRTIRQALARLLAKSDTRLRAGSAIMSTSCSASLRSVCEKREHAPSVATR